MKLFKISRIVAISLLSLTGINAIIAGTLFIIDPTGKMMGMSTSYLSHAPFSTFLVPGMILLFVNGLMNVMTAVACIKCYKPFPGFVKMQGLLLSGWTIIQVTMVRDFNGLHFLMLLIGVVLVILGTILQRQFKLPDPDFSFDSNKNVGTTTI